MTTITFPAGKYTLYVDGSVTFNTRESPIVTDGELPSTINSQNWVVSSTGVEGELLIIIEDSVEENPPVTNYQYQIDDAEWFNFDPPSLKVKLLKGLAPGVERSVKVRKVNLIGAGIASGSKTATPNIEVALPDQATAANSIGPLSFIVDDTNVNTDFTADFTLNGNTLLYEFNGLPTGVVDDTDGTISGTPTQIQSGVITCIGRDEFGRQTTSTANYSSELRSQAVAANTLVTQTFVENSGDQTYDVSGDFTSNGNTLTYSVSGPSGVSINSSTGVVTFTTDSMSLQVNSPITVSVTDEYGRVTTSTFNLTISEASVVSPIFIESSSYIEGGNGAGPTLSIFTQPTSATGPFTLYLATHESGVSLTKDNLKNGTGAGADYLNFSYADLVIEGQELSLTTSLTNGRLSYYIESSDDPVAESPLIVLPINVDATAPTISGVVTSSITSTTADATVTVNETGTSYIRVRPSGDPAWTAEQITSAPDLTLNIEVV